MGVGIGTGASAGRILGSGVLGKRLYSAKWLGGAASVAPLLFLCAEHDRQLGGATPLRNQMEVKL
jgi:hypothetical protein